MALNSPYLAAENPAQRRSRALHRFIVASPVLLLLAVGLVGHLRHPPHKGAAGTPDFDRRVLAYRDRVIEAERLTQNDDPPLRPFVAEASRWVAGFDAGSLTALTPAAYEDHFQYGVRGEIYRAGIDVASGLTLASERCLDANYPQEAAPAALLAARLANGLRGFELQACLQSMVTQRRSIDVLVRAWPSLSASERHAMRRSLVFLKVAPEEIDRLYALDESQFQDYLRRQPLSNEAIRGMGSRLSDEALAAIRRSIRLSNRQVDALLASETATPPSKRPS